MEETQKFSFGKAGTFAGAIIAFFIGAGFASGQEVMQYFASYGWGFIIVVIVSMTIFTYTNWSFANAGAEGKFEHGSRIFPWYCGKAIGAFYDIFTIIFCYLSFIVMCGGASSTATQQFGVATGVGSIILVVTVVATVIFGLDGVVNVLGKIGPVIIALILFIGIWTVARDAANIAASAAAIQSGAVTVLSVGTNPVTSAFSYAGFVMLWFATFMAEIGAKNRKLEVNWGIILGTTAIAAALVIMSLALIANIYDVSATAIPSLLLASLISPGFAIIFSVIVFAGIYTTATPLLWTTCARFFEEGTSKFRIAVIVLGALGVIVALFVPYQTLVNVVYGVCGYVGYVLIAFMLVADIRRAYLRRVGKDWAQHDAIMAARSAVTETEDMPVSERSWSFGGHAVDVFTAEAEKAASKAKDAAIKAKDAADAATAAAEAARIAAEDAVKAAEKAADAQAAEAARAAAEAAAGAAQEAKSAAGKADKAGAEDNGFEARIAEAQAKEAEKEAESAEKQAEAAEKEAETPEKTTDKPATSDSSKKDIN